MIEVPAAPAPASSRTSRPARAEFGAPAPRAPAPVRLPPLAPPGAAPCVVPETPRAPRPRSAPRLSRAAEAAARAILTPPRFPTRRFAATPALLFRRFREGFPALVTDSLGCSPARALALYLCE